MRVAYVTLCGFLLGCGATHKATPSPTDPHHGAPGQVTPGSTSASTNQRVVALETELARCQNEHSSAEVYTTMPTVDEPEPEGGWWCVETLTAEARSGCVQTKHECEVLASAIRTSTLTVPDRCTWQPKAACFDLFSKLTGGTTQVCSSLLSICDTKRKKLRARSRDYRVDSVCRPQQPSK
jgi:hypothetical protein